MLTGAWRVLRGGLWAFVRGGTREAAKAVGEEKDVGVRTQHLDAGSFRLHPLDFLDLLSQLVNKSLVVVDDDPDLRGVLVYALSDEGYEVRSAPDGLTALEMLETWRPSVILLDLMMPVLDGWGFRARQLARADFADLPVIVLSAARDLRLETLRPNAVIPKPFNLMQLLDTVANLVH